MGMDRPPVPFTLGPTEGQYFTQWRINNLVVQFTNYQRKSEHHLYFFQCWIEKREDDEE
jgi:hypothetical protein